MRLFTLPARIALPLLVAVIAAGMAAILIIDLRLGYAATIAAGGRETEGQARVLEEHARQRLLAITNLVAATSRKLPLAGLAQDGGAAAAARARLIDLLPGDGVVHTLALLAADGTVLAATSDEAAGDAAVFGRSEAFRTWRASGAAAPGFGAPTRPAASATTPRLLPLAVRLGSAGAPFEGALVAGVDLAGFQAFYDALDVGTNGFATMFLRDGWIVVRKPASAAVQARNWAESPMFKSLLPASPVGTQRQVIAADRIERVYSYRAAPDLPVVVSYGVSLTDALAGWQQQLWRDVLTFVTLLVVLCGSAWALQRQIARRNASMAALGASEERYRSLSLLTSDWFWRLDAGLRYVEVGGDVARFTGVGAGAQLGRTPWELPALNLTPADWERQRAVLASHQPFKDFEILQPHADGQPRWFAISGEPTFDAQGVFTGYRGAGRDITQRKHAELALEAQRQRSKGIIDSAMDGIITVDGEGRIVVFNSAAERMFGRAAHDMHGRTLEPLLPQRSRRRHDENVRRFGLTGVTARAMGSFGEVSGVRANGEEFPIEASISQINIGGEKLYTVTLRDVSQQRQAQAELRRYQNQLETLVEERTAQWQAANAELVHSRDAAAAASLAKSIFLANMSHELRTPMNAIMGMTHLAQRQAEDVKLREQLAKIATASRHLLHVINDILDISKIEAGRLTLEKVNFDLADVRENVMGLMGPEAAAKRLNLQMALAPEVARQPLLGDPMRLGQILVNLIGNALKFTDTGTVQVRVSRLDDSTTDLLLHFAIQDTGIGISAEGQKRLFTAFEQADGSTTRKYGGTGLGLAISKRLVQLMNGDIGVESSLGRGARFWFTGRFAKAAGTPRAAVADANAGPEAQLRAHNTGARILLAEDEPVNQEVAVSLLEHAGLTVDLAEDGVEAVEMARMTPYDLILLDMQMPKLDGIGAARAIRKLPGCARIPILAMTANAFSQDRQACMDAGMNDHIAKPVDPQVLFASLTKWLAPAGT